MRPLIIACAAALSIIGGCEAPMPSDAETAFFALDGGADGGDAASDAASDSTTPVDEDSRVRTGLIAEWQLTAPAATLPSTAGSTPLVLEQRPDPDSLEISMSENSAGGIDVQSGGFYLDELPAEVFESLTDGDGFSFEVWVSTDNRTQNGPARVFTLSDNSAQRNLTLGQQFDEWALRFRHENADLDPNDITPSSNGLPALFGPLALTERIHAVVVYDGYFLTLWQNGEEVATVARPDGLGNWDETFGLALMNEFINSRQFQGTLYLFAMWDRSLTGRQIRQNFLAGPGGAP